MLAAFRKRTEKQIVEDFNLAKELSHSGGTSTAAWSPPTAAAPKQQQPARVHDYGATSSKTADVMDSIFIPNDPVKSDVQDDKAIAQLLQAEFDLEYDEELKRLEQNKNKSEQSS